MSKMTEYINAAIGYDASGLPASTVQFTFGLAPFKIADNERIEDVTEITAVVQSDCVVDIKVLDNVAMVSFDFSMETNVLADFAQELSMYVEQKDHITLSLNEIMDRIALAEMNGDAKGAEDAQLQIRSLSIPFMLPTILPTCFGGSVQVGFADDPKFVLYTSDQLNQPPYKVTMIFDVHDLFCQDDVAVYTGDTEEEIRMQQEEMWYMDEARRIEEENYQAQFGASSIYDDDDDDEPDDKRLRGVRIK